MRNSRVEVTVVGVEELLLQSDELSFGKICVVILLTRSTRRKGLQQMIIQSCRTR